MWGDSNANLYNAFLLLYLNVLASNQKLVSALSAVTYHLDEANSDKEAKKVVQTYMVSNPTLPNHPAMNLQVQVGLSIFKFEYCQLSQVRVANVYLPEQLTDSMKSMIKDSKNNTVYTSPDLYIELSFNGSSYFTEIELKSTKANRIPGSSVQQINPHGWVVFIRQNPKSPLQITTGLYVNSITETMQFPDRSPRPQVAFDTLRTWNNNNLVLAHDGYTLFYDESEIAAKELLISNWKQSLVSEWLTIIFDKNLTLKPRTPWFTEAITMFSNQLIENYECLSELEKQEFRRNITSILANK